MPGPPPKHPSVRRRRNDPRKDFRTLKLVGIDGPPPSWPLQADVALTSNLELNRDRVATLQNDIANAEDGRTRGRLRRELSKAEIAVAQLSLQLEQAVDAERDLWADLWKTPQAVIWKEAHAFREVAQYVRWKIRAEQGDMKAGAEARMLSDRLGLNPLALLRLRAEIENVDEAEHRGDGRRGNPPPAGEPDEPSDEGPDEDPRSGLFAVS